MRRLDARILHKTAKKKLAGYLEWYLFELTPDAGIDQFAFFEICDSYSQELSDFASELLESPLRVSRLLEDGPIAFMNMLEIRPPFDRKGVGIRATKAVADHLQDDVGLHSAFMIPVPLQYRSAEGVQQLAHVDDAAFRRDRERLTKYYRAALPLREVRRGRGVWFWKIAN